MKHQYYVNMFLSRQLFAAHYFQVSLKYHKASLISDQQTKKAGPRKKDGMNITMTSNNQQNMHIFTTMVKYIHLGNKHMPIPTQIHGST